MPSPFSASSLSSSSSFRSSSPFGYERPDDVEIEEEEVSGLIDTPCSSPASSNADLPMFLPYSKREYLLAQIRQKDAIIESLLKQVESPLFSLLSLGTKDLLAA